MHFSLLPQVTDGWTAIGNVTVEQSSNETAPYLVTDAVMTYDSGNRLIGYNGQAIEYDADGNMTRGPYPDRKYRWWKYIKPLRICKW